MLYRLSETPVMQAAATYTEDYDSPYDSPICYDSSSRAQKTETDEDTTDTSSDSDEDPALSPHTPDNDLQGRPEGQGYQMLDKTPTLHP